MSARIASLTKLLTIALLFFFSLTVSAQAGHTTIGRGGINQQQQTGQGQQGGIQGAALQMLNRGGAGGAGGAGGGAGGGGGAQYQPRSDPKEAKEIAKKSEENLNKMSKESSGAIEKLSQSFQSSLPGLKAPDIDQGMMKNLTESLAKRQESIDKEGTVGESIISDTVKGTKSNSDTLVETTKQVGLALAPPPPAPPIVQQPKVTLGERIQAFMGGQTTRSGNVFEQADRATSQSSRIPSFPGTGTSTSGGPVGPGGHSGPTALGAVGGTSSVRGAASSQLESIAGAVRGAASGFAENNFSVMARASSSAGLGSSGVSLGGVSTTSSDFDRGIGATAVSAAPVKQPSRGAVSAYSEDDAGTVLSVRSNSRGASSVGAATVSAIDSFISSDTTVVNEAREPATRTPSSVKNAEKSGDEDEEVATAKASSKKKKATSSRGTRGARSALLKRAVESKQLPANR